jgi:hypothetical protein
MRTVSTCDIAGFQSEIESILSQHRPTIHKLSQDFKSKKLDMEITVQEFVKDIESQL